MIDMAKKTDADQPERRWHGDEVEDEAGDQAERAAERAEGNEPVRADAESRRLHEPSLEEEPEAEVRRPPRGGDPEDDTAAAAEEHAARRAAGERSPRGKI